MTIFSKQYRLFTRLFCSIDANYRFAGQESAGDVDSALLQVGGDRPPRKKPSKRRRLSVEHDDQRTNYLEDIVNVLNVNDEELLHDLIFRFCSPECVYLERYFESIPVLPAYREMTGPDQIFNYLMHIYKAIPDALVVNNGSKLYERTDGTSYLIGRLKFSGIGFYHVRATEVTHSSSRFLSKWSPFAGIYETSASNSSKLARTSVSASSSSSQIATLHSAVSDPILATNNQAITTQMTGDNSNMMVQETTELDDDLLFQHILSLQQEEDDGDGDTMDDDAASAPLSTASDSQSVQTGASISIAPTVSNLPTVPSPPASSVAALATKPAVSSGRKPKTVAPLNITPRQVLVSTERTQYQLGSRTRRPYKVDIDLTIVLHIDNKDWQIWKCECYNHAQVVFRPESK